MILGEILIDLVILGLAGFLLWKAYHFICDEIDRRDK